MRLQLSYRTGSNAALSGLALLAMTANAVAQEPLPSQPPVIQPLPPPPPSEAYPPAPPPALPPPPPPGTVSVTVQTTPPEEEKPAEAASPLHLSAFVDAYYAFQTSKQGTAVPPHFAYAFGSPGRTAENGFSLSFAGIDASYDGGQLGATISLRAGPSVNKYYGGDSSPLGIENVTQAYVTWTPIQELSIDFGQFATIFGAEVAESWQNLNYTRGALFWLGQPVFHTGLRLGIDPSRMLNIKVLAVNGWNRSVDNNAGKTFGLQGTFRLPKEDKPEEDMLTIAAGYMFGPEHADSATVTCPAGQDFDLNSTTGCRPVLNAPGGTFVVDRGDSNSKGMRHFLDLAVTANPVAPLRLLFNASLGIDNDRDTLNNRVDHFVSSNWWGVMAAARYALIDELGLAGRVEYYADPKGVTTGFRGNDIKIVTGTLTADYSPGSFVKFFLDARLDWSSVQIFPNGVREANVGTAFSTTLGAVVSTN